GIDVTGGHAYVADWNAGLRVIDVSNPAAPVEVSHLDTPEFALGIDVAGSYAFVTDYSWNGGLHVVDISSPAAPVEVGYLALHYPIAVAVSDTYAYVVASELDGLRVIDISKPNAPVEVSFAGMPDRAQGVEVDGDYAYVADSGAGLRVLDISNPFAPREFGFYDTGGFVAEVAVSGGLAYPIDNYTGLYNLQLLIEPPTSVTIAGPDSALVQANASLIATVAPITTTVPITYVWQTTGRLPITHTAGLTDTSTFTWTDPGLKTIIVTVDNGVGVTSASHNLTVYTPAFAGFSATPATGVVPLLVQFTNESGGDYDTCHWDLGDGSTSGDCVLTTHTYQAPGVYTVTLTVAGPGGTDTMTRPDYITVQYHRNWFPVVRRP
ncbi:MAG: PKD domain-containing protein, partial [Chloroflexota bacterium]